MTSPVDLVHEVQVAQMQMRINQDSLAISKLAGKEDLQKREREEIGPNVGSW